MDKIREELKQNMSKASLEMSERAKEAPTEKVNDRQQPDNVKSIGKPDYAVPVVLITVGFFSVLNYSMQET